MNARTQAEFADEVSAELAASIARERHLVERAEALQADLEDEGEWHTPRRPEIFRHTCGGCVAQLKTDCDGGSTWKAWEWSRSCAVAEDGVPE